jgi:hypothetical protein
MAHLATLLAMDGLQLYMFLVGGREVWVACNWKGIYGMRREIQCRQSMNGIRFSRQFFGGLTLTSVAIATDDPISMS